VKEDPTQQEQQEKWIRELDLIYLGLITIGAIIVQPFIMAQSLDVSARICILAISLALPLLAFLVLINQVRSLYHIAFEPPYLAVAKGIGLLSACVGVIAAFWHMFWMAGVLASVSGIAGGVFYTLYYRRLALAGKVKIK
jgi:hypothetical protein